MECQTPLYTISSVKRPCEPSRAPARTVASGMSGGPSGAGYGVGGRRSMPIGHAQPRRPRSSSAREIRKPEWTTCSSLLCRLLWKTLFNRRLDESSLYSSHLIKPHGVEDSRHACGNVGKVQRETRLQHRHSPAHPGNRSRALPRGRRRLRASAASPSSHSAEGLPRHPRGSSRAPLFWRPAERAAAR